MSGLLKKDLIVADKSGRLLLVLALAFSLVPRFGALGSTYAMMLAFMLPLNSIAYDEKSKWDRYAAMLPCRAGQIVWSKYLLSYIYTLLAEAIILVSALIREWFMGTPVDWTDTLQTNAMLVIVMVLVVSLGLPSLYRFGSEKGRLVMVLILGVGVGTALFTTRAVMGKLHPTLPPLGALMAGSAVTAVVMTALSFRLSVRFYKKRLNGAYN